MSDITNVSDPLLTRHISAGTKPVVQEPGSPTDDSGASTKRAPLPLRVYTPEPLLRHPVRLVREMGVDIWSGRELAWRLFIRDLSASYRQTWFGYAWAFLPPLANALTFVFLHSQGLFETGATTVPYAAFAMISTLLWQVFVDALNSPVASLLQAKADAHKDKLSPRVNPDSRTRNGFFQFPDPPRSAWSGPPLVQGANYGIDSSVCRSALRHWSRVASRWDLPSVQLAACMPMLAKRFQ